MKRVAVSQSATGLFIAMAVLTLLSTAAANTKAKAHCSTPSECCDVCGTDSLRCARGPCSSSAITTGFFFISMPTHFTGAWDVVFTFYGMVPSLVPVLLALELLLVRRTWTRVFAFLFVPVVTTLTTTVLVRIFGACEACLRPCGTCLSTEGMPSGHSASSIGMWLWIFLETLLGVGRNLSWRTRVHVTLASAVLFAPVPYSRVHLGDHTPLQVSIGAIVGVAFAVLYFMILRLVVGKKLDRASQWLAERRCVSILIENDYYTERSLSRADGGELAQALIGQPYATYSK
ncbi:hypothetical protein Gpo141_00014559 [Globisporangium polare]